MASFKFREPQKLVFCQDLKSSALRAQVFPCSSYVRPKTQAIQEANGRLPACLPRNLSKTSRTNILHHKVQVKFTWKYRKSENRNFHVGCALLFGPLFTSSPLGSFTSVLWYADPCQKIWLEKAYRYCLTSFLALLLLTFKLTVSCKIETRSHMHTCKLTLGRRRYYINGLLGFGKRNGSDVAKSAINVEVDIWTSTWGLKRWNR